MIHRKSSALSGISASVSLDPQAAASSNNTFTNNVFIDTKQPDGKSKVVIQREIELPDLPQPSTIEKQDVRTLILESYANILLDQDVALIANLVSKHTIIIPLESLRQIIQCITGNHCEIVVDEDANGCCVKKVSPIVKIDFIKVITDEGQIITDFRQYYNKEWNELTCKYHLNLKYVVI